MADQARTPLSAEIQDGCATFKAAESWSRGRLYGAIKHWHGVAPELLHRRRQHTFVLTLGGGTELTGIRISGSPVYEGRDRGGCVTFVPSGAERRAWYRNADMSFFVLLVEPDFIRMDELADDIESLAPFTNRRDPLLEGVLWSLASEMHNNKAGGLPSLYVEHAAGFLVSHLIRASRRTAPGGTAGSGLSAGRLRAVLDFIEENLDRDISLSDLGALIGMGPDIFARHFKRGVGMPPYRYVIERRLRRAEILLTEQQRSIAEIALDVGFASQSHFTTQFSKFRKVTPAAYRARHRS
jgi:AraC family transcriptional regulator